jgi:4-carboxymuconolactone decarboxylase
MAGKHPNRERQTMNVPDQAGRQRMPPIARERMSDEQRAAADELIAGPRKAVKGPFIALMRSPALMARLQKVGEFLRFESALSRRVNEFATLVVARQWTQQFEWFTHVPLALKAGTSEHTIADLRQGRRPAVMSSEEALVYDFVTELAANKGVSDASYQAAVDAFGEAGVIELTSLVGYFVLISMVLNVAGIPADEAEGVEALPALPL